MKFNVNKLLVGAIFGINSCEANKLYVTHGIKIENAGNYIDEHVCCYIKEGTRFSRKNALISIDNIIREEVTCRQSIYIIYD